MTSPDDFSSKKAAIIELLKEGRLSNKEIAERVGTHRDYVAKVKCLRRKELENYGEIHNTKSPALHGEERPSQGKAAVKGDPVPATMREGHPGSQLHATVPHASYQSLSAAQRRTVWTAFDKGKSRVDVVKKFGLDPVIVRREYEEFLEFQGISLQEMQGTVIRKINESKRYLIDGPLKHRREEYEGLVTEYNNKAYVGTKRFLAVLDIYWQIANLLGKESITDVSASLPKGWIRPNCALCDKPLEGILFENEDYSGQPYIEEISRESKAWFHYACSPSRRRGFA